MNRRSFLKAVPVVTATGAASVWSTSGLSRRSHGGDGSRRGDTRPGGGPAPRDADTGEYGPDATTPGVENPGQRYETVVNVADAGVDPSGTERIDDAVHELAGEDTLLEFPEGRYRVREIRLRGLENFGMIGHGATLVVERTGASQFFRAFGVSDFALRGFVVDATADDTVGAAGVHVTGGRNLVGDYAVEGFGDVDGQTSGFTLTVEGAETSLTMDRIDLSDGARNGIATFVFPPREFIDSSRGSGTLTFRNCVMEGWGKEGLYASAHAGPIRVLGGEYANNGIAQVRVGGGNAPSSALVRGVHVRVDQIPGYMPSRNRVLRGIWLKEGDLARIENCEIDLVNVGWRHSSGAVVVHDQFGRATIRDTTIRTNIRRPAIYVKKPTNNFDQVWMPSLGRLPEEWDVTCENVDITTAQANTQAVYVHDRDEVRIADTSITQTGDESDGIRITESVECEMENVDVDATRYPAVVDVKAGTDTCAVTIADCRLSGGGLTSLGEQLAPAAAREYCASRGLLPEEPRRYWTPLAVTKCGPDGLFGRTVDPAAV